MPDNTSLYAKFKLTKKQAICILALSALTSCLYVVATIVNIKSSHFYEASLDLPVTSQGEIAELYKQSPFKSLRITFKPGEYFSQAGFLISTAKKDLEQTKKSLFIFLEDYYKTRKPYPTFVEHDLLKVTQLEEEIIKIKKDVANALAGLNILKKKYHSYHPSAFITAEEKIIIQELSISNFQMERDSILENMHASKIKLLSIKETHRSFFSISLVIKTFLIFISTVIIQIILLSFFKKNANADL